MALDDMWSDARDLWDRTVRLFNAPALDAHTVRKLLRPFEAVALLLQGANLGASVYNDHYQPAGDRILIGLAVAHLVGAGWVLRYRGPLTRGLPWTLAWIMEMFVVQLLVAHLINPGDFANYGNGIQAGNVVLIPLAVLAFYPWPFGRYRGLIELVLISAVIVQPIVIVGVMNAWSINAAQAKSLIQYGLWAIVWFLVGKGIDKLCRIAVQAESDALIDTYEATLTEIHNTAETVIDRIEAGENPARAAETLRAVVYRRRRALLLETRFVGVVEVLKNAYRLFGDQLTLLSTPRVGGLTLPPDRADLLDECLANSLKNVVRHGGGRAHVDLQVRAGRDVVLTVRDEGPGLTCAQFDDPASTMQRIRKHAVALDGDFVLLSPPTGAAVQLTFPLS